MAAEERDGMALPAGIKSEAFDFAIEQSSDAPPQAFAENASLAGLSVRVSDTLRPREAFNREMYRIPSYAGWFSWGKIHAIERRALPEFFDGFSLSKTPKVYKEYREFVINKYRENPRRVLTFTEVRKMLVGDVNLLRKVYDFLEYWGLINYHVASENKQQQTRSNDEKSPSAIMIKTQETAAESVAMLGNDVTMPEKNVTRVSETMTMPENNVTGVSETMTQEMQGAIANPSQEGQMAVISIDKPQGVMQVTKLSSDKDALSPSVATHTMEGIGDSQTVTKDDDWLGNWSMGEVLRLLEGIRKFGEDWNRVAAHVGTKSRVECVLRFIKLPFGDQFTSNIGVSPKPTGNGVPVINENQCGGDEHEENSFSTSALDWSIAHENFGSDEVINEPPFKKNRLSPFADSSNPILAQVAFLSGMVGPRVAIAAAQAAVSALAEEDPVVYQTLQTGANALSGQTGSKDQGSLIGSQATSAKAEDVEGEDTPSGKISQTQAAKDFESSGAHFRAASIASASAANIKLGVDQEERDIEHIVASILEDQFRKLQSKVEQYEELEFILEKESLQLERARLQVLGDWIRFSHYHYNAGPT